MSTSTGAGGFVLVLDTTCLWHFALSDRLDVLRDLLITDDCWTTRVVLEEIRAGVETRPALALACEIDWLSTAQLDSLDEIRCFLKWAELIGSGKRDLGEASVIAAAELRNGVAITDDRNATRVGRTHGARVHGTLWLLARACREGKLTEAGAGGLIDGLRSTGARLPCTGPEFPVFARSYGLL